MTSYQKLLQWHWDIGERLAADELLAGVPVVTAFPKDYFDPGQQMVQQMERLLAVMTGSVVNPNGKSGLAILVGETSLAGASSKMGSLTFRSRVRVLAVEARRFNGAATGFAPLSASVVAAIAADNLQNFADGGVMDVARPQEISAEHGKWLPAELRARGEELDLVTWGLEVHSLITLPRRVKTAAPVIAVAGGNATLTCGTAGASIRYTLDGSYPALGGWSVASGASVPVSSGQTMRAVAALTGLVESDAVGVTVS